MRSFVCAVMLRISARVNTRDLRLLVSSTILVWRNSNVFSKDCRKITEIIKSHRTGYIADAHIFVPQQALRLLHAVFADIVL